MGKGKDAMYFPREEDMITEQEQVLLLRIMMFIKEDLDNRVCIIAVLRPFHERKKAQQKGIM